MTRPSLKRWHGLRVAITDARDSIAQVLPAFLGTRRRRTPQGFLLRGSRTSAHHRAMQEGRFEPEETATVEMQLREAEVFVDVGANIGYYSCLARQAGCQVVAVEPLPRNLRVLRRNLKDNGFQDVEVQAFGLADAPGSGRIFGTSGTGASLVRGWARQGRGVWRTIRLTTLDALLEGRFEGQRLLLKIDVEGAEFGVLQGSRRALVRQPQPTWLVEVCLSEHHPGDFNHNFASTFAMFWEHGYAAYTADRRRAPVTRSDVEAWIVAGKSPGPINYLFVPEGLQE